MSVRLVLTKTQQSSYRVIQEITSPVTKFFAVLTVAFNSFRPN